MSKKNKLSKSNKSTTYKHNKTGKIIKKNADKKTKSVIDTIKSVKKSIKNKVNKQKKSFRRNKKYDMKKKTFKNLKHRFKSVGGFYNEIFEKKGGTDEDDDDDDDDEYEDFYENQEEDGNEYPEEYEDVDEENNLYEGEGGSNRISPYNKLKNFLNNIKDNIDEDKYNNMIIYLSNNKKRLEDNANIDYKNEIETLLNKLDDNDINKIKDIKIEVDRKYETIINAFNNELDIRIEAARRKAEEKETARIAEAEAALRIALADGEKGKQEEAEEEKEAEEQAEEQALAAEESSEDQDEEETESAKNIPINPNEISNDSNRNAHDRNQERVERNKEIGEEKRKAAEAAAKEKRDKEKKIIDDAIFKEFSKKREEEANKRYKETMRINEERVVAEAEAEAEAVGEEEAREKKLELDKAEKEANVEQEKNNIINISNNKIKEFDKIISDVSNILNNYTVINEKINEIKDMTNTLIEENTQKQNKIDALTKINETIKQRGGARFGFNSSKKNPIDTIEINNIEIKKLQNEINDNNIKLEKLNKVSDSIISKLNILKNISKIPDIDNNLRNEQYNELLNNINPDLVTAIGIINGPKKRSLFPTLRRTLKKEDYVDVDSPSQSDITNDTIDTTQKEQLPPSQTTYKNPLFSMFNRNNLSTQQQTDVSDSIKTVASSSPIADDTIRTDQQFSEDEKYKIITITIRLPKSSTSTIYPENGDSFPELISSATTEALPVAVPVPVPVAVPVPATVSSSNEGVSSETGVVGEVPQSSSRKPPNLEEAREKSIQEQKEREEERAKEIEQRKNEEKLEKRSKELKNININVEENNDLNDELSGGKRKSVKSKNRILRNKTNRK